MAHPVPILVALGGILVAAIAAASQTGGSDKGAIYGGTVVLVAIGAWLAKDYLSHKGEAARHAGEDREAFRKQAEADRAAFHEELRQMSEKMQEMNHALMGIAGRGGLLTDRELDQKRRHDLSNQVHRLTLVLARALGVLTEVASKVGVHVDPNLERAIQEGEDER